MARKRKRDVKHAICPTCNADLTRMTKQRRHTHWMFRLCRAKESEEEEEEEEKGIESSFFSCSRVPDKPPTFEENAKLFTYCCPVDLNMAPHINVEKKKEEEMFLTLAVCKPAIRKTAKKGDWVIAKLSKSIHDVADYVRYVWRVTDSMDIETYYSSFGGNRRDQIYASIDGVLQHKKETKFHNGPSGKQQQKKDLKKDCKVLISKEFCSIDPANPQFFVLSRDESIFKAGRCQMGEKHTENLTMDEQEELYQFMKLNSKKK